MTITLKTRLLYIKIKHKKSLLKFNELKRDINSTPEDFFYILYNQLHSNIDKSFTLLNDPDKIYSINKLEKDDLNRCIFGLISYGEKGIASNLVEDYGSGALVTNYSRKTSEYELQNYFFLIYIPQNRDKGYVIVQANSRQTIIKAIEQELYNALHRVNQALIYKLNKYYLNNELYAFLTDSHINNISFIGHRPSQDIADLHNINTGKCVITTTLSKINDSIVKKIFGNNMKYLKKGIGVKGGIEFEIGHTYDDVKVSVNSGGREKIISIKNDYLDLDDDITSIVETDINNNPIYSAIKTLAIDKLNKLR